MFKFQGFFESGFLQNFHQLLYFLPLKCYDKYYTQYIFFSIKEKDRALQKSALYMRKCGRSNVSKHVEMNENLLNYITAQVCF